MTCNQSYFKELKVISTISGWGFLGEGLGIVPRIVDECWIELNSVY